MDQVLSMGGYAAFIWPAYGLAAVVMIGILASSIRAARSSEAELETLQTLRRARRSSETAQK